MKTTIRKLLLSKSIFIALVLFCTLICNKDLISQTIDTMYVTPANPTANDSVFVHIEGWKHLRLRLMNVSVIVINEDIDIIFHYNYCSGFETEWPYQENVNIGLLEPKSYKITCYSLRDTILYDTLNCEPFFDTLHFVDSAELILTITNIVEHNNKSIYLYPNPATEEVFINCVSANTHIEKIKVYNSIGEIVKNNCFSNAQISELSIDMTRYRKGIYYVTFLLSNNEIQTFKLIKQ